MWLRILTPFVRPIPGFSSDPFAKVLDYELHFRSHLPTDAVSSFEDGMRWIATSLHVPSFGEKGIPGAYARVSSSIL